jgi:alcohol dehydrogenase class IV
MDGGKAICLTANNDIDLWAFEFEQTSPTIDTDQPFPKLITIPTTAGTGAETESTAMVTHVEKGMKFCIWHPDLKPSLVLLDPALTVGLPANLTAWTGADALTHAIEAYCVPGFHPLCDGMALEGTAPDCPMASKGGSRTGEHGGTRRHARWLLPCWHRLPEGAWHGACYFAHGRRRVQHAARVDQCHHSPRGLALQPAGHGSQVERMAQSMRLDDTSVKGFISAVERLLDDLKIPTSLGEIGVPADCAERIAEKSLKDSAAMSNPRRATLDDARMLVEKSIMRAR